MHSPFPAPHIKINNPADRPFLVQSLVHIKNIEIAASMATASLAFRLWYSPCESLTNADDEDAVHSPNLTAESLAEVPNNCKEIFDSQSILNIFKYYCALQNAFLATPLD